MTDLHTYITHANTSAALEEIALLTHLDPHELIAQDDNGDTPLHLAIKKADTRIATALIDALISVNPQGLVMQNHYDETPSDLIQQEKCEPLNMAVHASNIADAMRQTESFAQRNTRLQQIEATLQHAHIQAKVFHPSLSKTGSIAFLERLAHAGYDLTTTVNHVSLLHRAITLGRDEIASKLIRLIPADALVQTDNFGYAPLHSAIRKNDRNLAITLIIALKQRKPEGLQQLSPENTTPFEMLQQRQDQESMEFRAQDSLAGEALTMGGIFITKKDLWKRHDIIEHLQAILQPTENDPFAHRQKQDNRILTRQSLLSQAPHTGGNSSLQPQKKACSPTSIALKA